MLDLGTTLHHTFHDPASRQHGLWACKACARRHAKVCEAATAVAEAALQPAGSRAEDATEDVAVTYEEEGGEGLGNLDVLHADGEGEGVLELKQSEDEVEELQQPAKRQKVSRPLSVASAVMQMEAVRARGPAELQDMKSRKQQQQALKH